MPPQILKVTCISQKSFGFFSLLDVTSSTRELRFPADIQSLKAGILNASKEPEHLSDLSGLTVFN